MTSQKIIGENAESSGLRWFRATLMDAETPDRTIVFEFKAPFPVDSDIDYQQWAIHALLHAFNAGTIKIRDVEPIEIPGVFKE